MSHPRSALFSWFSHIAAALLLAGGVNSFAQSRAQEDADFARVRKLSPEASQVRFEYEIMRAEIRKPVTVLLGQYRNRLEKLEKEFQVRGDLDSVLFLRAELDSLEKNGTPLPEPPAGEPLELVEARKIYLSTRQPLEEQISPDLEGERQRYAAELGKVVETFVKEGEEAKAVHVQAMIDAMDGDGQAPGDDPAGTMGSGKKQELDMGGLREIEVLVQVDGISHLMLRGDEIWYDHSEGRFAAPGQYQGDFPTTIGADFEWMPEWKDGVTRPLDGNFGLPADEPAPTVSIRNHKGRGYAEVVEQPSSENGYTAKIALRDQTRSGEGFYGADWIGFRIVW